MGMEDKAKLARRTFELLANRRTEAASESFAPDATFDFSRSRGPNRGIYVGRDRIRRNWDDVVGMWAEWVIEPHDFFEPSDDQLLFSVRGRMVGRDGIELHVKAAQIWTIRDGLIAHAEFFQSREDALDAAGLRASDSGGRLPLSSE
jgi:ketosteroid isomerase-like protein